MLNLCIHVGLLRNIIPIFSIFTILSVSEIPGGSRDRKPCETILRTWTAQSFTLYKNIHPTCLATLSLKEMSAMFKNNLSRITLGIWPTRRINSSTLRPLFVQFQVALLHRNVANKSHDGYRTIFSQTKSKYRLEYLRRGVGNGKVPFWTSVLCIEIQPMLPNGA